MAAGLLRKRIDSDLKWYKQKIINREGVFCTLPYSFAMQKTMKKTISKLYSYECRKERKNHGYSMLDCGFIRSCIFHIPVYI